METLRWLHRTPVAVADTVIREGLRTDMPPSCGSSGLEWVLDFYDVNPVYLSSGSSGFDEVYGEGDWSGREIFEVDASGLPLAADLPTAFAQAVLRLDPHFEYPATLWFVHLMLARRPGSVWNWFFNDAPPRPSLPMRRRDRPCSTRKLE